MLEVRNLRKRFGGNTAVENISFDVLPGQMLALIGPNGAGKSTCFNLINGQLPADGGIVRLKGESLLGLKPEQIARLGVARTFQIAATFPSLSVIENVQIAMLAHRRNLFSFWRPAAHYYREQALELLRLLDMQEQADRACSELAYGDVKRVELAIALASDPGLLLMDEPTAGMAPAERRALMSLVKNLVKERGFSVLFTEHSMDVVFDCADHIIVMARGALIAQGDANAIRSNLQVQAVYFGSGSTFEDQAEASCSMS